PVQGAAVQLLRLRVPLEHGDDDAAEEPGGDGADAGGDGEVHVLRAADQSHADRGGAGGGGVVGASAGGGGCGRAGKADGGGEGAAVRDIRGAADGMSAGVSDG